MLRPGFLFGPGVELTIGGLLALLFFGMPRHARFDLRKIRVGRRQVSEHIGSSKRVSRDNDGNHCRNSSLDAAGNLR